MVLPTQNFPNQSMNVTTCLPASIGFEIVRNGLNPFNRVETYTTNVSLSLTFCSMQAKH